MASVTLSAGCSAFGVSCVADEVSDKSKVVPCSELLMKKKVPHPLGAVPRFMGFTNRRKGRA